MINLEQDKAKLIQLLMALESLGSATAIAEFFEKEGIKGARLLACSCPVANYLKNNGLRCGVVPYTHVVLLDAPDWITDRGASVSLTNGELRNVNSFAARFDNNDFPKLVRRYS